MFRLHWRRSLQAGIALWLLLAGIVTLAARLLRTSPVAPAPEPTAPPTNTEPADAGSNRALAGLMLILALLVLVWSVFPAAHETAAIAAGIPLIVLFVLLLHLRRHTSQTGP